MLKRIGLGLLVFIALVAIVGLAWEPLTATAAAPPPARIYDARIVHEIRRTAYRSDQVCLPLRKLSHGGELSWQRDCVSLLSSGEAT